MLWICKFSLNIDVFLCIFVIIFHNCSSEGDVLEVRRRYPSLYIPSDFFLTHIRWVDSFPPNKPFALNKPCSFHIMNKDAEPLVENDALVEPPDADYLFSSKVRLHFF